MTTKTPAAIYVEPGKPMVIDEIDLPDPGPTQVSVRHFATGVCHSQLHELHRPEPKLPMVLGHESTGVVTAVGRDVTHVREGDHVMVTWVPRNATRETPLPTPAHVTYGGKPVEFGAPAWTGTFTWSRDTVADQQMVVPLDKDVATDVTSIVGCAVMTGAGAALHAARGSPGRLRRDHRRRWGRTLDRPGMCQPRARIRSSSSTWTTRSSSSRSRSAPRSVSTHARWMRSHASREIMGGELTSGVDHAFDAIGVAETMTQVLEIARGPPARRARGRRGRARRCAARRDAHACG